MFAIALNVPGFTLIGQPAGADDALLKAPLVACASDKAVIGGVNACGKIWKIGSGEVTLKADGKLTVSIQGLVLNDPSVGKYDRSRMGSSADRLLQMTQFKML